MKKLTIIAAVIVLIVFVWVLTRPNGSNEASAAFSPQVERITRGDLRVEVSATGVIEPINKVEIKSKASGLIEELSIEEADKVSKNDLIARLDQRDTKNIYDQSVANLEVAEANVKQKESDFERKQELYEKGLISAVEFDQAKLAVVEARAQVVRARIDVDNNDIRLKDTIVRSPIDGVVLTKDVEEGQIISSGLSSVTGGTLIATVADMREVYVKTDVDEVDIGRIKPGMKAQVVADAYPTQALFGEVIRIAAQAKLEQNVTTFEVTIKVENPAGILKAGMNASVDIVVADKKNVLLLPNEALMTLKELNQELAKFKMALGQEAESQHEKHQANSPEGQSELRMKQPKKNSGFEPKDTMNGVIVKVGDDYQPRPVKVGINNFDYTEVLEGLNEGDEVAYAFFSRAKASSDRFRERMSNRVSMSSGFRSSRSSGSR